MSASATDGSGGHYRLDVDPDLLRATARGIGRLAEHVIDHGTTAARTPDDIGSGWTGTAAASVKAEMAALGHQLSGFSPKLDHCARALRALAREYDDALTHVEQLNRKRATVDDNYSSAVAGAERRHLRSIEAATPVSGRLDPAVERELARTRDHQVTAATTVRDRAARPLDHEFAELHRHLRTRTASCAATLRENTPVTPTRGQLSDLARGVPPIGLDHRALIAELPLLSAREMRFSGAPADPRELLDVAAEVPAHPVGRFTASTGVIVALDSWRDAGWSEADQPARRHTAPGAATSSFVSADTVLSADGDGAGSDTSAGFVADPHGVASLHQLTDRFGRPDQDHDDATTTWRPHTGALASALGDDATAGAGTAQDGEHLWDRASGWL